MSDPGGILIFGEVLVDQFPDGHRVLGGAPFNVAWHLTAFGRRTRFVSRVGNDEDGARIRSAMAAWGMDTRYLQVDRELPTGSVTVMLEDGQPTYDIVKNCAYDNIDGSGVEATGCTLVYHGTLALRSLRSREALERIRRNAEMAVFMDVNLRERWWEPARVNALADKADWVKLNEDELSQLSPGDGDVRTLAHRYLDRHALTGLIVTMGSEGAMGLTRAGEFVQTEPDRSSVVVDTVGAGDAFAAIVLLGISNEWPLSKSLTRARAFASLIVRTRGAIVEDRSEYDRLIGCWAD